MKALILGVTGQDGGYLARLLLQRGYEVAGTTIDDSPVSLANLERLGLRTQVETSVLDLIDSEALLALVRRHRPDEVYNLAGQTSVSLSFERPVETLRSIAEGTLNVLEAVRSAEHPIRLFSAGSGDCFGDTGGAPAGEQTPFRPRSPYAVAKSAAHWLVRSYREAHGLHASTAMLFNHESPLRPEQFVTQKIVRAAARIKAGSSEKLILGNTSIRRDWGWAPEYVEAMWLMLQQDIPDDYVIATGRAESLEYFVAQAFAHFGLDWREHVTTDPAHLRPSDLAVSVGDPAKAREVLGWAARTDIDGVIAQMCVAAWADTHPVDAERPA